MFGVKTGDLKVIAKTIKGQQSLACELYETGNADAMYLAGMLADGSQMSKKLLDQIVKQLDTAPDRVRYAMNGFVISVGSYVEPFLKQAKATAEKIGVVVCDLGDTACKVPLATAYID